MYGTNCTREEWCMSIHVYMSIGLCDCRLGSKWFVPQSHIVFKCHYSASPYTTLTPIWFNTLRPRQNEHHFADDIFKCIFLNENVSISIKIWLKFVPKGPINNIPALVQIMAWRRTGDKPLSEPMMVNLPTHICVTRPQWVKCYRMICRVPQHQSMSQMLSDVLLFATRSLCALTIAPSFVSWRLTLLCFKCFRSLQRHY